MNLICHRWKTSCLLALAVLLTPGVNADKPIMHISTSDSIVAAPYISDFVDSAYRRIGYQMEIMPMPAKRSLYQARESEEVDGVLARTVQAAGYLPKHILIPVPVSWLKLAAFVKSDELSIQSWSDLSNYKVAAIRGNLAAEHFLVEQPSVFFLTDAEQALNMLERGRVDVAILPLEVGLYWIKKNRHRELTIPPTVIEEVPMYHFLHSRHQDLVEPLTQAMQQLRAQAELIQRNNPHYISPAE